MGNSYAKGALILSILTFVASAILQIMFNVVIFIIASILGISSIILAIIGIVKYNQDKSIKGLGVAIAAIGITIIFLISPMIRYTSYFAIMSPNSFLPERENMRERVIAGEINLEDINWNAKCDIESEFFSCSYDSIDSGGAIGIELIKLDDKGRNVKYKMPQSDQPPYVITILSNNPVKIFFKINSTLAQGQKATLPFTLEHIESARDYIDKQNRTDSGIITIWPE